MRPDDGIKGEIERFGFHGWSGVSVVAMLEELLGAIIAEPSPVVGEEMGTSG